MRFNLKTDMETAQYNEEMEQEIEESAIKRGRTFFAKEFRQSLSTDGGYEAIKEFVHLCTDENGDKRQDYALEYIESGGGLSELLRIIEMMDKKNASHALPVFQAFSIILLKILARKPQNQLSCEESCRELLVKHFPIIKTMLCLNSNSKQRKVSLKLLSTMATMSPTLAKDVLAYAAFDRSVLEVLTYTSPIDEGTTVRTSFIHFLLSFLVEGSTVTIITFLEKRGLLTSIFNGLIYDKAETVELVLSTIQNKVLEDKFISKTIKMNTFNTKVVQNLVNLYNWKGPGNRKTGNIKKRMSQIGVVDQEEKQRVCECVHGFLLVLCTTKFGVIFRDPTIGLSGKVHNSLMLTVLQGLSKPWDHKLASELVVKICIACPDLVKYVLQDVAPFLEPRVSQKWINAVKFVKTLIESLSPDNIGQFLENLTVKQIGVIIQTFCVPKNILQALKTDAILHENMGIRHETIELLYIMCKSVSNYLAVVKNMTTFSHENKMSLKNTTMEYLTNNLPLASIILTDWQKSITPSEMLADPDVPLPSLSSHLCVILDVLYEYQIICPPLIDVLMKEIEPQNFLQTIEKICIDDKNIIAEMQVKAINLFLLCDSSVFSITMELFEYVTPLLLNIYCNTKGLVRSDTEKTLCNLLTSTGIFEGCEEEIKVWLCSILEYASYTNEIGDFLVSVFKLTSKNFLKYVKEITALQETVMDKSTVNFAEIIDSLKIDIYEEKNSAQERINHTILSPLVIGILETLSESDRSECSMYLNIALIHLLHFQTAPKILTAIILQEKYKNLLSKHVIKYYRSWEDCTNLLSVKKNYHITNIVTKMSTFLISNNPDTNILNFTEDIEWESYHYIIVTKMIVFYLTQLAETNLLTEIMKNKCFESIIHLLKREQHNFYFQDCLLTVFKHPLLLQIFTPVHSKNTEKLCTDFILNIIQELLKTKSKIDLDIFLNSYRTILVRRLHVMLEKSRKHKSPPKTNSFMKLVTLLDLSLNHCGELLKVFIDLPSECMVSAENTPSPVVDLLCYILNRNEVLYCEDSSILPFNNEVIVGIGNHLVYLNSYKVELSLEILETNLFTYLQQFPHTVGCLNENVFKSIIFKANVNRTSARLAMLFLRLNIKYLDVLIPSFDEVVDKRELVFSLLMSVLESSLPSLVEIRKKVYVKHEQIILKALNKPQKVANYLIENYKVIVKLVSDHMSLVTCKEFASKNHKFDCTELYHFEILTAVYNKCISEKSEQEKYKYISNYIITVMNLLIGILKRPEKSSEDWNKIESVSKSFCMYINKIINVYKINYTDDKLSQNAVFQTFTKLCLKFGLLGYVSLVNSLKRLCDLCSGNNKEYLGMLFEMAVSHSESLNILLDNQNKVKPSLINLLLVLCKKCPSIICKSHIPVWLGAYEATLSVNDQMLLQLLALYEEANIGFHEFRPYLWGKVAVGHYSVRFGLETAIWRQPKPVEVLDILNQDRVMHTITYFPRSRILSAVQPLYSDDDIQVYDPAFYLPLLSHLLAPESTIRWYQCKFGAIALVIVALTSEVAEVRSAACHVLARFHSHLEAAKFGKDRLLWIHFVEAVCRATSTMENLRLSTIAAVFMSRCALVFNRPDHALYNALGQYIMAKECPDLSSVPELLLLLHSNEVNHLDHRVFILEVMRDGLKTENDLKIMLRCVAFKLLMDLFNSVLINHEGKRLILEVLTAAVSLPMGAKVLSVGHSLISWLHTVLAQFGPNDADLLIVLIDLMYKLVHALDTEHFIKLQFNILLLLTSVIKSLKVIRVNLPNIVLYIKNLYIVYNNKPRILTKTNLCDLIDICGKVLDCHVCNYYLEFGSEFVNDPNIESESVEDQGIYYLKLLTLKWIVTNKK